ncbi:MAG: S1 RNA-binding domain-containing protein [Planctomycetaceae bacterium]|jgi:small subunit ribosomal protein S1|nr:S1 RNA-binding domain-containing protein [Planctomycetaceae bacterium]
MSVPEEMLPEQPQVDLPKPKRLIGSQRNPEAYRPAPVVPVVGEPPKPVSRTETYPPEKPENVKPMPSDFTPAAGTPKEDDPAEYPDPKSRSSEKALQNAPITPVRTVQIPKVRGGKMSDDLEAEFAAVFGDEAAAESLLKKSADTADDQTLEPDTKVKARVLSLGSDNVFLDLGVREQGIVSYKMFPADEMPKIGQEIQVTVIRFSKMDGLYEVSVPLAAADVRDWSQVQEGMVVEALVTKTNTGGLECEVNRLRGFMPISQIDLFRVENTEQYVGQKLTCIVDEVNVERRNLVLSRKSLLLREREEKRNLLLASLEIGQEREGLVRKLIDAGAFVDLGGADGFIPIGAMSWGRIRHPSDVLTEGTRIKVRIAKIDENGNRIGLIYRDDSTNPWANILERFQPKTVVRGKVTKITDFGAFVELMPGVEGLVHISELSVKRVGSVKEVVKEGDWIDVFIIGIDGDNRKMALSMKEAVRQTAKASETVAESQAEDVRPSSEEEPVKIKNPYKGPLRGGTESTGSGKFGLKW